MNCPRIWFGAGGCAALLLFTLGLSAAEPLLPKATAQSPAFLTQTKAADIRPAPQLICPSVDYRKWQTWEDVGNALKDAPTCAMGQSWQPKTGILQDEGTVAVAHFGSTLIVYAEFRDTGIFNPAEPGSEKIYSVGDVFEIFLRPEGTTEYMEHHISSRNVTDQLRWSPPGTGKNLAETRKDFPGKVRVQSQVLVQSDQNLWRVLALVPLEELPGANAGRLEKSWYFSFGRYDYEKDNPTAKPVVSSTSPHKKRAFHTQSEWGRLKLAN